MSEYSIDSEETEFVPYVTHDDYPEITVRGCIIASILAMVLGAANTYLGLLVGMTVSASIPASVISMAILRSCFSNSNILENNIVQTATSAGEALAAGVIFTIPGLVVIENQRNLGNEIFDGIQGWTTFLGTNYAYTTLITMLGGFLGIAWSVPIRKAIIVDLKPPLKFPEGVATAQVLKAGEGNSSGAIKSVALGAGIGALMTLFSTMGLWKAQLAGGWFYASMYASYFCLEVKPALLGVGYIIGPQIAGIMFAGAMFSFWVIVPLSGYINGRWTEEKWMAEQGTPFTVENVALAEWSETRYIGVGMMLLGAVHSIFKLRGPLVSSVKLEYKQLKSKIKKTEPVEHNMLSLKRYQKDLPFSIVGGTLIGTLVPLWILFSIFNGKWGYSFILSIVVGITSFLFSAVAAYMAGLVGSSNNPVSGVTICSCLVLSGLIVAMFPSGDPLGPPTAVIMSCAVATACSISSDNMQDLKAGYLLGATPWRQEIIMALGVFATSLIIAPVLEVLNQAYVLGSSPRDGGLSAPQATVIATIPAGIVNGNLPWTYIGVGVGLGALIIIIDTILEYKNCSFRLPILAFAVAIYLPIDYLSAMFLGAMIHFFAKTNPDDHASEGILYCAGIVAGDSLLSVFLAVPIVVTSDADVIKVISDPQLWPVIFPILILLGTIWWSAKKKPFTGGSILTKEENDHNNFL